LLGSEMTRERFSSAAISRVPSLANAFAIFSPHRMKTSFRN
jgi:hypothetical protein